VPTGVALQDAREQLFAAAERILHRDGPQALTSRAVTTEAGCAKGVLHRHFADFDDFLAELVRDRITQLELRRPALLAAAGTGTVAGNVTAELTGLFGSVAVAIVALITFRDDLRARLRTTTPVGVPLLTEAGALLASYLAAERDLGRLAWDADVTTLAPTLLGASHLLFAGGAPSPPDPEAVQRTVTTVLASALRDPARARPGAGR